MRDPLPSSHPAQAKTPEGRKVPAPDSVSSDLPLYLREPWSCRGCKHRAVYKPLSPWERDYCRKDRFEVSCVFARDPVNGSCRPDPATGRPQHFEEKAL